MDLGLTSRNVGKVDRVGLSAISDFVDPARLKLFCYLMLVSTSGVDRVCLSASSDLVNPLGLKVHLLPILFGPTSGALI